MDDFNLGQPPMGAQMNAQGGRMSPMGQLPPMGRGLGMPMGGGPPTGVPLQQMMRGPPNQPQQFRVIGRSLPPGTMMMSSSGSPMVMGGPGPMNSGGHPSLSAVRQPSVYIKQDRGSPLMQIKKEIKQEEGMGSGRLSPVSRGPPSMGAPSPLGGLPPSHSTLGGGGQGSVGGPPSVGSGGNGGGPPQGQQGSSGPEDSQSEMVRKCVRFFRTLIQLSQNPDQENRQTHSRVKILVSNVIYGDMAAEEFTMRLQEALRSQAQPHLLPFLQKTLPHLRAALASGEVVIEGISPPAPNAPRPLPIPVPREVPSLPPSMAPPMEEEQLSMRVLKEPAIKSVIISPHEIMTKITRRIKDACYVDEDVLTLISDAAEYRLRKIVSEVSAMTEHRLDSLRTHAQYMAVDDVKRQLRFVEDVDRQVEERREAREKEQLIRMSKSKNIGKETMDKAKEMQKAEADAKRNRDANAAAIAALSSSRGPTKPRWDDAAAGKGMAVSRPRALRVNLRDIQTLLARDLNSRVAGRIAYALPNSEQPPG